jgi:hypothetical protein
MLLILDIKMKAFGSYSEQMRYNRTTSILVAVHTWRIFGVVFLWGMTQGILEPTFAIPAGVGDILVGITAIPFAIFLWKGYYWSKNALVIWTTLAITDIVYAMALGLITNPDFGTSPLTTFPWILVPTVVVPVALALDGIVMYRLRKWTPRFG